MDLDTLREKVQRISLGRRSSTAWPGPGSKAVDGVCRISPPRPRQGDSILCFCRWSLHHPAGECGNAATRQPVHAGVRVPVCGACWLTHERAALETGRSLIEAAVESWAAREAGRT